MDLHLLLLSKPPASTVPPDTKSHSCRLTNKRHPSQWDQSSPNPHIDGLAMSCLIPTRERPNPFLFLINRLRPSYLKRKRHDTLQRISLIISITPNNPRLIFLYNRGSHFRTSYTSLPFHVMQRGSRHIGNAKQVDEIPIQLSVFCMMQALTGAAQNPCRVAQYQSDPKEIRPSAPTMPSNPRTPLPHDPSAAILAKRSTYH